jgi:hypothetical protein
LSHDAAGFVCGRAHRAASHSLERAGADPSKPTRRDDFSDAVNGAGEPARCRDVPSAARVDSGESACGDDRFSATVQSGESANVESRSRQPVHAPGDAADEWS